MAAHHLLKDQREAEQERTRQRYEQAKAQLALINDLRVAQVSRKAEVEKLTATMFQCVNIYFVVIGIVYSAFCQGSHLTCSNLWSPLSFLSVVHIVAMSMIWATHRKLRARHVRAEFRERELQQERDILVSINTGTRPPNRRPIDLTYENKKQLQYQVALVSALTILGCIVAGSAIHILCF